MKALVIGSMSSGGGSVKSNATYAASCLSLVEVVLWMACLSLCAYSTVNDNGAIQVCAIHMSVLVGWRWMLEESLQLEYGGDARLAWHGPSSKISRLPSNSKTNEGLHKHIEAYLILAAPLSSTSVVPADRR